MVSLATSGQLHGRHFDFNITPSLSKRLCRISPNLIRGTCRPSDIFAWNNDVITYILSAAVAILKKNIFCRKWAARPRVTKIDTEVHPDALCNFAINCVSSYFRSAVITCLLFADNRRYSRSRTSRPALSLTDGISGITMHTQCCPLWNVIAYNKSNI